MLLMIFASLCLKTHYVVLNKSNSTIMIRTQWCLGLCGVHERVFEWDAIVLCQSNHTTFGSDVTIEFRDGTKLSASSDQGMEALELICKSIGIRQS